MMIKKTQSICPVCSKILPAEIVEEDGRIFLEKKCPVHGFFKELYWSDAELFEKFSKFEEKGFFECENPGEEIAKGCPFDCGLCKAHETQTLLAILDVTNRCNLMCSYCFANSAATGYLFEPSFNEIEKMMDLLRAQKPVPVLSLMFSGGEPLIRKDIAELVKKAKEKGFVTIFIATNGILLTKQLAKDLAEAGVTTLYLKFNGVSSKTNTENHKFIPQIIENCRSAGLQITLVPTVIKGFNDHEASKVIEFALENMDIVRSVNFQPVSFCGRMPEKERNEKRITIPCVINALEKQSDGMIPKNAFFPIPSVVPFSRLAENLLNKKQVFFSIHPHCGAATYLIKEGEKVIPMTDFIDVNNLLKQIDCLSKEKPNNVIKKALIANKLRKIIKNNIIEEKAPKSFNFNKLLFGILTGNFDTLIEFNMKSLFVGTMHFQDKYNLDIARLKKCGVHYVTWNGKIIPFCAYNLGYREKIEKSHSKTLEVVK